MYRLPHVCTVHPSVERVPASSSSAQIRKMMKNSRPKHTNINNAEVQKVSEKDFSSNNLGMLLAHPVTNYQLTHHNMLFPKSSLQPTRSFASKTEPKEVKEQSTQGEDNTEEPSTENVKQRKEKPSPDTILRVRVTEAVTNRSVNDPTTPRMTIAHLENLINSGKQDYTLVDLREDEDLNGEPMIPTAVRVPVPTKDPATTFTALMYMNGLQWEIRFKVSKLTASNKPIIFYSNTGVRSDLVTQVAVKELGLTNAVSLIGGARLWNKYKNPEVLMASDSVGASASPSTGL